MQNINIENENENDIDATKYMGRQRGNDNQVQNTIQFINLTTNLYQTIHCQQYNDIVVYQLDYYGEDIYSILIQSLDKANRTTYITYICDLNGVYKIKSKAIKLQIMRYMLRLNNSLRVGSFFIDSIDGSIGFKIKSFDTNKLKQQQDYTSYLNQQVDKLIQTAVFSLRFHIYRLLFMMNILNINKYNFYTTYLNEVKNQKSWRGLPKDAETILSRIKTIFQSGLNNQFNSEEYKEIEDILNKQLITDQKIIIPITIQRDQIIELSNLNNLEQFKINEGGFCVIYAKQISYTQGIQQYKRQLAFKVDKNQIPSSQNFNQEINFQKSRNQKEKDILYKLSQPKENDKLLTGQCAYIVQFYESPPLKSLLFMERYFYSSLDNFKARQRHLMSLSTKVYILLCIASGLRYIHKKQIIHMDIKPANILISKTLVAKITDFGEAHEINDQNKHFGKTYPYAAPECYNDSNTLTTQYDIFSFGVMMFELLFEKHPIDYRKTNQQGFDDKMKKLTYSIRFDVDQIKQGPQKVIKYLAMLSIQCLQPNAEMRPDIEKIVLVLKDVMNYLEKVY